MTASVMTANPSDGSRAPSSLWPTSAIEAAPAQANSGGFAQKGDPGAVCGVIQLPDASMTRAMLAYRASVRSVSG